MSTISKTRSMLFGILILVAINSIAEFAQAQAAIGYPAQRGHIVQRHGVFGREVYRERYGNGLTSQGAAFLTHAVDAFAPAVLAVAGGRDIDDANRSGDQNRNTRSVRSIADLDEYVKAQQEANELLKRTESLAKYVVGGSQPSPQPTTFGRKLTPSEVQQQFGPNPWKE